MGFQPLAECRQRLRSATTTTSFTHLLLSFNFVIVIFSIVFQFLYFIIPLYCCCLAYSVNVCRLQSARALQSDGRIAVAHAIVKI